MDVTTDAIYGIHNPFRDHDVREAWDNYRPGIPNLGPKALPSFMASKSIRAREHVVKALMHFFQAGYHKKGSELLMARYKYIVEKHQVKDLYDLARLELAGAFASIENTVPTAFWFFYRLYSDPVVLKECRDEVSHIVEERNGACYIDVDSIKSSCPILQSTLHETIRYHSTTISARKVTEDYVLDQYVLKKGSTILIPASVPHFNEGSWGTNAGRFDYTRFIPDHDGHTKKGARRMAFRGFGGGYHLCPGRHFAVTEMLSLASMVVLRFDITPVDTIWATLEKANLSSNGTAAPVPDKEFPVIFLPRDTRKWVFFVSGKGNQMDLLATE
ncbi:cytochrome P450 [Annulohypoxylon stygium]|nr:cytochrome P450 [Annulohypoxylon stygium]